jgi:hypothetical protein
VRAERLAQERPAPEPVPPAPPPDAIAERISDARKRVLAAEEAQARRAVESAAPRAPAPRPGRPPSRAGADELQMRARRDTDTVDRERTRRLEAEQRVAALERTLAERTDRWARAYAEIDQIRDEIGELRRVFAQIEPATPAEPAAVVQADRLSEALTRLRERAQPAEEEPPDRTEPDALEVPPATSSRDRYVVPTQSRSVPPPTPSPAAEPIPSETPRGSIPPPVTPAPPRPTRAWLWPIFRDMARDDPLSGGQLLVHLLPAWHAVDPLPVAGDLILGDRACVQVTVGAGATEVRRTEAPRRPEDVHFQVRGDLGQLARTLLAGRLRRRLGRGMARVSGDHEAFERMGLLARSHLRLDELHDAGVRLDPAFTFALVARMIEPAWTVSERFTIAHRIPDHTAPGAYLVVKDGAPVVAGEGQPPGPADTTIVASVEAFPRAVTGRETPGVQIEGAPHPLVQLSVWLQGAQSG